MELMDLLQEIAKITGYYPHIEKFSMRNACVIGTWLEAAFTKFEENKADRLSGNFEDWLNVNTHTKHGTTHLIASVNFVVNILIFN